MTRIDNRVPIEWHSVGDQCKIGINGVVWTVDYIYKDSVLLVSGNKTRLIPIGKKVWIVESKPTLIERIIESVETGNVEKEIAKKHVLHHLKQLKAQMGGIRLHYGSLSKRPWTGAIDACINAVSKKIDKIKAL